MSFIHNSFMDFSTIINHLGHVDAFNSISKNSFYLFCSKSLVKSLLFSLNRCFDSIYLQGVYVQIAQ